MSVRRLALTIIHHPLLSQSIIERLYKTAKAHTGNIFSPLPHSLQHFFMPCTITLRFNLNVFIKIILIVTHTEFCQLQFVTRLRNKSLPILLLLTSLTRMTNGSEAFLCFTMLSIIKSNNLSTAHGPFETYSAEMIYCKTSTLMSPTANCSRNVNASSVDKLIYVMSAVVYCSTWLWIDSHNGFYQCPGTPMFYPEHSFANRVQKPSNRDRHHSQSKIYCNALFLQERRFLQ